MEEQLRSLDEDSQKVGLTMHRGKTKFITNYKTIEKVKVRNDDTEKVTMFKYLGQEVRIHNTMDVGQEVRIHNTMDEEINNRVRAGRSCYNKYREFLNDRKILSTMTY